MCYKMSNLARAVVVVKWSACSPPTLMSRVLIPRKSTVFSVKFVFERTKINEKEAHFKNVQSKCLAII